MLLFVFASSVYVTSLAIIDGLVNRLIFRENSKLSYFSAEKQEIYKRKEWFWYCFLFLIILPFVIPTIFSFLIGGIQYVLVYILILAVIDWDIIFGKIVFDKWFGDLPSICLPFIGWVHFKLLPTIIIRLLTIVGIVLYLV
ncbi:MAG: hypothetical protein UR39_C0003G0027 [Candidatus Woesebacteria bacterium GW2011_GWA1_33_30]|uniref:Uncharacterized protein n=1 Tax=Candidatus Woesebacteria bacterium GW2011_GWA2_33_28 TaxID=1618561 RepID=A0A0F9ZTP1_9BACT|nr:MAG: hypothetical protein UR38_C0003G0029 [Candidatus Woesebacteria bacterium GW2011_GWA2_33_28]KKP48492.1 MAG: hypothetical protein UR39_C0003G0027 [Candidatus Woesebacteria bacterium GW2011_GWA1_33_30]KKP49630.1 MAG: hypothetical protein UR40_C0004G0029 [Microgenomates group bacterium GW2011_GWC1_33_32]KKP52247.1 MAG: hypothetical protein UR44_C0003G0029 [Candidatus Woesebacteria bacterium GW2011_GWB1_33_38]KKP58082.1 MAG: hypothetical protein UR48_C0008G0015 [Microgenomates group bacteriu